MSTSSSSSSSAVPAWVADLPSPSTDLTPLSQSLLTPQLASAFRIPPEPFRTLLDVHSASLQTLSSLKSPIKDPIKDPITDPIMDPKRTRLVWTPQLHKRFVDVVGHLGVKSAVPKTIMQMMNVEGLTRENVASHLQKYRLYLKRVHGFDDDDDDGVSENQEANSRFNDSHN